MNEHKNTPK